MIFLLQITMLHGAKKSQSPFVTFFAQKPRLKTLNDIIYIIGLFFIPG